MKFKYFYFIVFFFFIWLLWLSTILFIHLDLKGEKVVYLEPGEEYIEPGATASFFHVTLHVAISGGINTRKSGTYLIYYSTRSPLGLVKKKKRKVIVWDRTKPKITLRGGPVTILKQGEQYKEPGYDAWDEEDGNITNKVIVKRKLNENELGTSQIVYYVADSNHNDTSVSRTIRIVPKNLIYLDEYDKIDNTIRGWGHGNKKDHKRPIADVLPSKLAKYNAYYMGENEKVIYLTFDEGSNDTYLKEIVDVLNQYHIKATFFLCRRYMLENKDLIKNMVKHGHVIGNHTSNHDSMPRLANKSTYQKYVKEIVDNEKAYEQITGKKMKKLYREPAGEWSYRSLSIIRDMGYRTYFWSAAYVDFGGDLTKDDALHKMMQLYHNGVIFLMHPKNKGNYLALEDFIHNMKRLGYRFDTVDHIGG